MKQLLALSHSGVLEVNRAPFQALARQARVEVILITHERSP